MQEAYETHLAQAPRISVGDIMDRRIRQQDPQRRTRAIKGIEKRIASVERCLSMVGRCTRTADRVAEGKATLEALGALESELVQALRATRFISGSKQEQIARAYDRAHGAEEMSELLAASKDLYLEIRAAGKQVLPGLREVLREIRCQI